MQFMGLKSKIRNPKNKREVKDTVNLGINYIKQNFKDDFSRAKVFTDTTQFNFPFGKVHFSALKDANETMYSLDVSFRNDEELIQRNISKGLSKIGRKYFIQFDNAAFYKNRNMKELLKKTKGIASYNYPGRSLDNRPIEFH